MLSTTNSCLRSAFACVTVATMKKEHVDTRLVREALRAAIVRKHGARYAPVARRLGVHPNTLGGWLRNERRLAFDVIPRICDVLGVDLLDLLNEALARRKGRLHHYQRGDANGAQETHQGRKPEN